MENPFFSIVVPLFNASKYYKQLFDSIIDQTFTDFELVIVDDCSTDGSFSLVSDYLNNSSLSNKYKLLRTATNSGCAGIPGNLGMLNATGKYFVFVDCDDSIKYSALQEIKNRIDEFPNVDIIHFQKYFLSNDDNTYSDSTFWKEVHELNLYNCPQLINLINHTDRLKLFCNHIFHETWSGCIRRSFVVENNIKFLHTATGEDIYFWLKAFLLAGKLVFDPYTIFYVYRNNNFSISRQIYNISFKKYFTRWILDTFIEQFDYYDNLFNHLASDISEEDKYNFYNEILLVNQFKFLSFKINKHHFSDVKLINIINPLIKEKLKHVNNKEPLLRFLIEHLVLKCQ